MGFSEWCNEHRRTAGSVAVVCVVAAIGSIVWQVMGQRRTIVTHLPDQFFSVDDGKTFFATGSDNFPPFDYHGQEADQAYVFECGGNRFVGYLERFNPQAHKAMMENKAGPGTLVYGRQLKKPGDKVWVNSGDFKAAAMVADVHCPDGSKTDPVQVEP
jgi:hypothetical protein